MTESEIKDLCTYDGAQLLGDYPHALVLGLAHDNAQSSFIIAQLDAQLKEKDTVIHDLTYKIQLLEAQLTEEVEDVEKSA